MVVSAIQEQRDVILDALSSITRGEWKILIVDETSKKILDNAVKEDDVLNQNIANIEMIEDRRDMNPEMDAIYFLSPEPHIADCLMADLDRYRYRSAFLLWTSLLDPQIRRRLQNSAAYRDLVVGFDTMAVDFFPRESHLITFRDPWSFPVLYHPRCNNLVREHMQILAQKIMSVCVTLGEYPRVRYYRPPNPLHEASVLCSHLARFVQEELDSYAEYNRDFPPETSRPPSFLVITDRSMDLMAPLLHEFTYQAMAHDLLRIDERDKVIYHMKINEGTRQEEEKDMELQEKDKVWVDNRHRHMKDTIDKLMGDFRKFLDQNPNFTDETKDTTSLNAIRDMLAGLPQFQEMKEAYSLHLTMAQECMNKFQYNKLPDIAGVEQTMATGLDEDGRKAKNVLDQVVRLLDDEVVSASDRLRLIAIYILYRDGVIQEDINRLLAHSSLPQQDGDIIGNLELLGARTVHGLKETRTPPPPLFTKAATKGTGAEEELALSRYEPALQSLLEELCKGTLSQTTFPYVNPPEDPNEELAASQAASLRAGRPNWAAAGRRTVENRQRLIVFMAGGATYSESRACYDVSARQGRDIFLTTSHMLTPALFVRQVSDLSADKRRLDLPMDRPKKKAPAHLFERSGPAPAAATASAPGPAPASTPSGRPSGRPPPRGPAPSRGPAPPQQPMSSGAGPRMGNRPAPSGGGLPSRPVPPTGAMGAMTLSSSNRPSPSPAAPANGGDSGGAGVYDVPAPAEHRPNKLEKKRRNFLGMKK